MGEEEGKKKRKGRDIKKKRDLVRSYITHEPVIIFYSVPIVRTSRS